MSKLVKIAEEQIISSVTAAIKENIADGTFIEAEIPNFKTEIPADRNNGDYSANAAFMLSKALRMPPRKIAEEIQNKIDLNNTYFEKCEIAGPGFINFFLKNEFYADVLSDIDEIEYEWEQKADRRDKPLRYKKTKYSRQDEALFEPDYCEDSRFRILNTMRSVETSITVMTNEGKGDD